MGAEKLKKQNIVESSPNKDGKISFEYAKPMWNAANSKDTIGYSSNQFNSEKRLYAEIIDSLKAQLKMHVKRQVVPESEGKQLMDALDKVAKEISQDQNVERVNDKSIYEFIRIRLSEIAPEAYSWFDVARSEDAQRSGDLRLWIRNAFDRLDSIVQSVQGSLIDKAESTVKTIFPAYSHSQLAQPSSFGHHLLAYVEMFGRDRERMKDAKDRMNTSPYCAGEVAGNSYHISKDMVARSLMFEKACNNSVDAIASRDFVVECLSVLTNFSMHASKLAAEMIDWHSPQKEFVNFSKKIARQHAVLPFRRDPLMLEITRAKSSKISGALMSAITLTNSMNMQYSKDLEELNDLVINAFDETFEAIQNLSDAVADFTVNRKKMKEAASSNFSTAIDLTDWIVQNANKPINKAQQYTRDIIDYAIQKHKKLSLLELVEIKTILPEATDDIYSVLIPSRALISRRSGNGSNPVQIRKSIRAARRKYMKA